MYLHIFGIIDTYGKFKNNKEKRELIKEDVQVKVNKIPYKGKR